MNCIFTIIVPAFKPILPHYFKVDVNRTSNDNRNAIIDPSAAGKKYLHRDVNDE